MKYLIAIVLAVSLSLGVAIPAISDSGVSITLTTTVTGGSSGGGGWDGGDGPVPYTPPDYTKMFPSMLDDQETYGSSDTRPIQTNPPIPIPPVIAQQNSYTPLPTPVQIPRDDSKDMYIYLFIGLAAILVGLILYLILPDQRVR